MLKEIKISPYTTQIVDNAFNGCTGVDYIYVPKTVSYVGNGAFRDVPVVYYNGDLDTSNWGAIQIIDPTVPTNTTLGNTNTEALSYNGTTCFVQETFIKDKITYRTTSVGTAATCSSYVKEIVIPDSVTSYSTAAFSSLDADTTVYLPASITELQVAGFGKAFEYHYAGTEAEWEAINFTTFAGGNKDNLNVVFESPYVAQ
jgi:hypothetical protein